MILFFLFSLVKKKKFDKYLCVVNSMENEKQITISVPAKVYDAMNALAGQKKIPLEDFAKLAFVAGLSKSLRKLMK